MKKYKGPPHGGKHGLRGQVRDLSFWGAFLPPTSFPFLNLCCLQSVIDSIIVDGEMPNKDCFDSS